MKKMGLIMLCVITLFLTAFDTSKYIVLTDVEITLIQTDHTLRYDFTLINKGNGQLGGSLDHPGHIPLHINYAIRPNKKLAALMQMESNTKYKKMVLKGSRFAGNLDPKLSTKGSLEYSILNNADHQKVKDNALDATLIILNGTKVIAEISLKEYR